MNFDDARKVVLELLRKNGKAKNSEMLALFGGDEQILAQVREDLLFNDLADDKKGVGLVYLNERDEQPTKTPLDTGLLVSSGTTFTYDVFLSFASRDKGVANRIFDALCKQRLKVFWSPISLQGRTGAFWFEELGKALEQARHLIVLLSDDAIKSPYVQLEYMTFYDLMLKCKGRLLFPVYEQGFDLQRLPVFLKQLQGYALDKTRGVSAVIAILTGVISDESARTPSVQPPKSTGTGENWFDQVQRRDGKGIAWKTMKCRTCGGTLGCYDGDYAPAAFCPHCRARELGTRVDAQEAARRPAKPKLPIYDLAIAGVEPFSRFAFSTEAFAPGPHYAAYESAVQEMMVRLEMGESEQAISEEFQAKKKQSPDSQRFWASEDAVRDAKALRKLNIKSFPLIEEKERRQAHSNILILTALMPGIEFVASTFTTMSGSASHAANVDQTMQGEWNAHPSSARFAAAKRKVDRKISNVPTAHHTPPPPRHSRVRQFDVQRHEARAQCAGGGGVSQAGAALPEERVSVPGH